MVPDVISAAEKHDLIAWWAVPVLAPSSSIANRQARLARTLQRSSARPVALPNWGKWGVLGMNDLSYVSATQVALDALLRTAQIQPFLPHSPDVFAVVQEIIKHSAAFNMAVDGSTRNFTAMAPGALVANDGDVVYRVGDATEYLVFPNPDVKAGQRAGLMLVRQQ